MLKEVYCCDRAGCKNTTKALGDQTVFFNTYEDNWYCLKNQEALMDFCSLECLSIWAEKQIEQLRGGKNGGK